MKKVLMIGPGPKSNGGIAKVIGYYQTTDLWNKYCVRWIETFNGGPLIFKLYTFIHAVLKFIYNIKTDSICHIHFTSKSSAVRKFPFFLTAKTLGAKTISHIHAPTLELEKLTNWAFNYMLKESDKVIVLSNIWAVTLDKLVNRKYEILFNPAKTLNNEILKKDRLILYAGKLESRKGYHNLLLAVKRLENLNNYEVILAGNGEVEIARNFIKENVLQNVHVIGWQKEKEIEHLFNRAEIFVLPSYGEGFPISIIDALSNKCAVITSPVGGIPDILTDSYDCIFIEPGNISELSDAIKMLTTNKEMRLRLMDNGYKTALDNFNLNQLSKELELIYNSISK